MENIKIGTKVMWRTENRFVNFDCYRCGTIISETKTEFKTDNNFRIKKGNLKIIGSTFSFATLFDEEKYIQYRQNMQELKYKQYIQEHISLYMENCGYRTIKSLYETIARVIKETKENR